MPPLALWPLGPGGAEGAVRARSARVRPCARAARVRPRAAPWAPGAPPLGPLVPPTQGVSIRMALAGQGARVQGTYKYGACKWVGGHARSVKNPPTLGVSKPHGGGGFLPPTPLRPGPLAAAADTFLHVSQNVQAHVCTSG